MPATDLANLPSAYDHAAAQEKWYAHWEQQGCFHADETASSGNGDKPPFSVVIPPPNVTGALHLGHALNNTLQDILCRYKRMRGFNVLWMPGTDHAGIATQARVEKRILETEGKSRHDLGREGLVKRIWEWKDQYEERILGQLKQLGCSCDWERTRFTLDDTCARAVRETFFKLFADGKIYRGKRLVNWDTYLQTAVSDDEVFHEEKKGHFWHFHYPVVDPNPGEPESVEIATTRPETMLGDTAVAVHPDPAGQLDKVEAELKEKLAAANDKERAPIKAQLEALAERRATMLPKLEQLRDMAARGVQLELPLTDRRIPLIADIWAKPELGSGCVKITPAHDANDYEVWQRNDSIGAINIMNPDGTLADTVPKAFRGLTMKKARTAVLEALAEAGAHDPERDVEDRLIDLAHSDRSKTPIEPYLADQWFVKMDELAQSAMDAVTSGKVKILPERYTKTYLDWLSEKRDWPIGRQLWWGHRIPVWECTFEWDLLAEDRFGDAAWSAAHGELAKIHRIKSYDDTVAFQFTDKRGVTGVYTTKKPEGNDGYRVFVCVNNTENATKILELLSSTGFKQSEEVLDTWFSSALWPHSTLGWPEETDALKAFYPTSTLITSRDIITLWVARMVLMGEYNMGEVPFNEVYIHPKILDGFGETMSKSKGNGVDPLDVIDKFGADALRFGIAYLTTETQDVRMPVEFVCPHCDATIKQTKKNRILPVVPCPSCSKPFSTQWAETDEEKSHARGAVTSERFELGRNFCNKLWNASRFALTNLEGYEPGLLDAGDLRIEDRWLLSRLATVTGQVTDALDSYRYADAARTLYDFAWNEFCSFYIEMAKARIDAASDGAGGADKAVAQGVLVHALDTLLRLLHPMTPFLTEEVWALLGEVAPIRSLTLPASQPAESVCVADWPAVNGTDVDPTIESQFAVFQAVLGAVREVRQSQNIAWTETLEFVVKCDADTAALLEPMTPYFAQMAKAKPTAMGAQAAPAEIAASRTLEGPRLSEDAGKGVEVHVDIAAFIDIEAEKKRLTKELEQKQKFVKSLTGKLANDKFVANAPAEVVDAERAKLAEAESLCESLSAALEKLDA